MPMQQVSDHVYLLPLGAVNAYIIEDHDGTLSLVDTGFKKDTEKILAAIRKSGKDPQQLRRLILTHTHPDHAGGAAFFHQQMQLPVWLHAEDAQLMSQGIAGRLPHIPSPGLLNKLLFRLFIRHSPNAIDACPAQQLLQDGDQLPIAGGIQVITTPGHSKGHISLLLPADGILIAGDICAHMLGLDLSTVYEDREEGIRSILKAASFDFDRAVFGHGRPLRQHAAQQIRTHFTPML